MNESAIRCGVVGLGAMGAPMARHIAKQDMLSVIWNRSQEKAQSLSGELDVPVAADLAALAAGCNVILVCVSADGDLQSVIEQLKPGLQSGSVVLDTSTVSPMVTRALADDLHTMGVAWVDAPVSGGVEGAINGKLSVMAGGDSANIARVLPVLETFSASVNHMGEVGNGQATKAVNQVMIAGIAEAVCEGLAFAEKLNLPMQRLLAVIGGGAAGSWFLNHRGKTMLDDQFDVGFKLSLLLKDLHICRDLARDLDFKLPTVEAAIQDYTPLVASGDGDNDISGLIKNKRKNNTGT